MDLLLFIKINNMQNASSLLNKLIHADYLISVFKNKECTRQLDMDTHESTMSTFLVQPYNPPL